MFKKIEGTISEIEEAIIFISIISSLVLVFVNILLRYLFAKGFIFSEEYARYSMVLLVYIGVSQAVKKNSMIKVDILSYYFPRAKFSMDLVANIFSLIAAALLIWFGMQFTIWQYSTGQKSIAMELPMWIAYSVVPIGGFLMFLRYVVSTIDMVVKTQ